MAARAVPAFYLHFIYCGMQFAVVANELNMRIAIIPKENEKSEPFSNRKQVRIFLVWWARVDYASRAAKNSLAGCFCPAGRKAPGRCCSNPPLRRFTNFQIKQKLQCHYNTGVLGGRGWITQAALLKTAHWAVFALSSATAPQLFESTLGYALKSFGQKKNSSIFTTLEFLVERSNLNPNHCPLRHLWRRFHRK